MNWAVLLAALAAVITFVVTASGISLFGIGAAFRGLVAGGIANFVFSKNK